MQIDRELSTFYRRQQCNKLACARFMRHRVDMAYLEVVGFSDLATQSAVDGVHDSLEHLVGR